MTVTPLSFDNVVEIVSVLADAFHDYPVMRNILGPDVPGLGAPYNVRLHRLVQLFVSARAYRNEPLLGVRDDASSEPRRGRVMMRTSRWDSSSQRSRRIITST